MWDYHPHDTPAPTDRQPLTCSARPIILLAVRIVMDLQTFVIEALQNLLLFPLYLLILLFRWPVNIYLA